MNDVVPMLTYADGPAAMDWLVSARSASRSRPAGSTTTGGSPTASCGRATGW